MTSSIVVPQIPQLPLSWCDFVSEATFYCHGNIYALDLEDLGLQEDCIIEVEHGLYELGYYYKENQIVGVAAIKQDHVNLLDEKLLNNNIYYGDSSFSVVSNRIALSVDLEETFNQEESLLNKNTFYPWGWAGITSSQGGFGLEPVYNENGQVVGVLLCLIEITQEDYWRMVEEQYITHNEEFYQDYLG